jgi:hypothetical protein
MCRLCILVGNVFGGDHQINVYLMVLGASLVLRDRLAHCNIITVSHSAAVQLRLDRCDSVHSWGCLSWCVLLSHQHGNNHPASAMLHVPCQLQQMFEQADIEPGEHVVCAVLSTCTRPDRTCGHWSALAWLAGLLNGVLLTMVSGLSKCWDDASVA